MFPIAPLGRSWPYLLCFIRPILKRTGIVAGLYDWGPVKTDGQSVYVLLSFKFPGMFCELYTADNNNTLHSLPLSCWRVPKEGSDPISDTNLKQYFINC